MFEKFKNRYLAAVIAIVTAFVALLGYYLHFMSVASAENADSQDGTIPVTEQKTGKIEVTGQRGSILDVNGTTLAYNDQSYNIQFTFDVSASASSDKAHYTDIFKNTIDIIEKNGGELLTKFFIVKDENANYTYNTEGLSEENAQKRISNWIKNMSIDTTTKKDLSAEEIYYQLRARYRIAEDMEYDEAAKILSIWQEVQLGLYQSYVPITIAENVNYDTVIAIETRADELVGMSVSESSSRIYPYGQTACHIIGYEGKITAEDDTDTLAKNGYNIDTDNVGKTGIEATMEKYLTACSDDKKGYIEVNLDNANKVLSQNSYTAPKGGDNVVLTIDLKMQQVLEEALKKNIAAVNEKQQALYNANVEKYDNLASTRTDKKINFCESGAAIVMEVKTGRVLAMASYPGYDLNQFVGGISDENYQALLDAPGAPLFNNAVSSASVPGSIYKVITGVAGLEEGVITLGEVINDEGEYDKYVTYGKAPSCSVFDVSKHSNQTIVEAIKNSCNYYFYTVADRLGITKINEWADKFGVTEKTGIELTGEAAGRVGSQKTLYDNTKSVSEQISYLPKLVYKQIKNYLKKVGEDRNVTYSDAQLSETADRIIRLAGSNGAEGYSKYGPEIREILSDVLDIPTNISINKSWSSEINIMLTQLVWNPTDTITQGIGVTPTQITPIEAVRYAAAIANGGKILTPHIVDSVVDSSGNLVYETGTDVVRDLDVNQSYLNAIMKGMNEVVSYYDGRANGTAYDSFKDFKYAGQICGKTGTGKVSDIDLENNGWFLCLAPYNNGEPEIAIVVFLDHGYSGSSATPTAKEFLQYWFDLKNETSTPSTPQEGTLIN